VTVHATAILGTGSDPAFAGRRVELVQVGAADAAKRRQRLVTDAGTDVAIDLPRGTFLFDGAVLADDGDRVVVVARRAEEALVVTIGLNRDPAELVEVAARVGHAFGNQHVPVDVEGNELRVPITTSRELAEETVRGLGLSGVVVRCEPVKLARQRPLAAGHEHGSGVPGARLRGSGE
jgi:urease accessory protein